MTPEIEAALSLLREKKYGIRMREDEYVCTITDRHGVIVDVVCGGTDMQWFENELDRFAKRLLPLEETQPYVHQKARRSFICNKCGAVNFK